MSCPPGSRDPAFEIAILLEARGDLAELVRQASASGADLAEVVTDILRQIDAVLYARPVDGQLAIIRLVGRRSGSA